MKSGKDYTATAYYTDDYFAESSYKYNDSLATMSMSYTMSAFASSEADYTDKSKNAKALLNEIGCSPESIEINDWFTQKPTMDSIGVIAGNKKVTFDDKEYTLIALAVRGEGYESEWSSNFTIGTTGQHQGFEEAKQEVLRFLRQYISDQKISGDVKLWITGYSRSAATANLVAGALDSGEFLSDDILYKKSDIYTYCFETPAGALRQRWNVLSDPKRPEYLNIFNIINSSDPVPYVAPAAMGFCRYGVDKYLPSAESEPNYKVLKAKMLRVFNSLDSTDGYAVDDFQMKKISVDKNALAFGLTKGISIQNDTKNNLSQGVYLSNYINNILSKELVKTRSNYVAYYQDGMRELFHILNGYDDKQTQLFKIAFLSRMPLYLEMLAGARMNPYTSETTDLAFISMWLENSLNTAGITDYDKAAVDRAGVFLSDLLLALISSHPNDAVTLFSNINSITSAHHADLCYSWLASMDSNYINDAESSYNKYNNGAFRIIRINCDVDVKVYDQSGTLVASITNEIPDEVSSIISAINDNGEKIIVLPVSAGYTVSATARNDTIVNYGIDEYCAYVGAYNRAVDYVDVPLKQGEMLTGEVPAYTAFVV